MRKFALMSLCLVVGSSGCSSGGSSSSSTPAPQHPVAVAGGPYSGTAGAAVSFSGGGSSDPQGQALTYAWNFGDSGTGTGVSPSHIYAAAGTYTVSLTVTDTSGLTGTATGGATIAVAPLSGPAISGVVSSGTLPIAGAHVYLFAAGTTGYGQASVSLLNATNTGTADSVGAYVASSATGTFSLGRDYVCSSGQQLYLYALGGNAGSGANPASGMLAAIGPCPAGAVTVTMNEVSTIATAYALAGFAVDATHVSSSATAPAQVGVANTFANVTNLETLSTGAALATTPAGNGTAPQGLLNTLANILASCVNSTPACSGLLSTATADGTSIGTQPTDTAGAAINMAHHPGMNVAALYGMVSATPVFAPAASSVRDFSLYLRFTGGGLSKPQTGIAIDAAGSVWTTNYSLTATKLSSLGMVLSGSSGFSLVQPALVSGGGTNAPGKGIAVDPTGNVWVALDQLFFNGICELSNSGAILSGAGCYSPVGGKQPVNVLIDGQGDVWASTFVGSVGELSSSGSLLAMYSGGLTPAVANGVAIDGLGNVWLSAPALVNSATTVKISSSGALLSPAGGYGCGSGAIAIDASGTAWVADGPTRVCRISSSGSHALMAVGDGVTAVYDVAVDGAGNVWVPALSGGNGSVVELSNTGAVLSPVTNTYNDGFALGIGQPYSIAVDGSGDVWVTDTNNALEEVIGIAVPVVTPLSVGVKNGTLGTRP